jgi:urease accessory protein
LAIVPPETRVAIRAVRRGGDTVVSEVSGTEPWRPRVLSRGGRLARVALVQSRASLLGGDEARIEIDLDAGATLEIVELGATVAHHARGGPAARVCVQARLRPGARLVWLAQPLIAAGGCALVRETRIELAAAAGVLLRETLVLGREGEEPGAVRSHTRIVLDGRPVVEEAIETAPAWLLRSILVVGQARMSDSLTLAGLRDPSPPPTALQAHEAATLWRRIGPARVGDGDPPVGRWRGLVLGDGP